MKNLWLAISLLFISGWGNGPLSKANKAFADEQYEESIALYQLALQKYPKKSREIRYNIAYSYQMQDSTERALSYYHQSVTERKPELASRASCQIGILLEKQVKLRQALSAWKQALKYDPNNEIARYNYELLLKRLNPSARDTPEEQQQNPNTEPEENELPLDREERRKKVQQWLKMYRNPPPGDDSPRPIAADTLSLEQARQVLEAMRENETRFLQQLRKTAKSKVRPKERPDW